MGNYKIYENQHTGKKIKVKDGFNWPAFLFGPIYLLFKMMIIRAILVFIVGSIAAAITAPLFGVGGWIVIIYTGFKANEWYAAKLLNSGYKLVNYNKNNTKNSLLDKNEIDV